MLDRFALRPLAPLLRWLARGLVALGIGADAITFGACALGLFAALCIALNQALWGLALLLLSRLLDGLDGAVARLTHTTDRGAFLDITLDFLVYASVPLAFAFAQPAANALPAAVLLAAFIGTGSSFLAFSLLAERRGLKSSDYPHKGIYYLGGLAEASETLLCFALMCGWPQHFAWWAYGFAAMCAVTTVGRIASGWRMLSV
jgi:phosphatidylglycerophosphate synthase